MTDIQPAQPEQLVSARIRAAATELTGWYLVALDQLDSYGRGRPDLADPLARFLEREADRALVLEQAGFLTAADAREVLTPELLDLIEAIEEATR